MAARLPAAFRRTAGHRLALTATAVTVLVASVLAAAAATFAGEVTSAAVRRSLAQNPGSTILVTQQVPVGGVAGAGQQVAVAVRQVLPGLPVTITASLRSQILDLPRPSQPRAGAVAGPSPSRSPAARRRRGAGAVVSQSQIISLPGVTRRAVLTAGSWPGPTVPAGGPVPVAVPATAARLLRLAPGDRLVLRNDQTRAKVPVLVTGVFRPADPASPYWRLSPVGGAGVQRSDGFALYGPLVTSPAVAAGPAVPVTSAAWLAVPDFAAAGAGSLAALSQRLASGQGGYDVSSSSLTGLPQATVTTALPALLAELSTALLVARSQLLIGVLILLAVIGGAVAVAVRPLAAQREPEAALLAARGASRRQLATRGATEALLLAAPAAIIGPWLGSRLGMLLARAGPLARAGLVPARSWLAVTGGVPASAWLAGLAVAAGCAVIMALPWLRRPQSALRLRVAAGRQRPVTGAVLAGADLALVALALLAGWQLARYQAPVATGVDGALEVDPLLAAAPVLALAAGTVVMLRLLPLATRLADAAAARQRGLAVAVASWQLSRRPLGRVGPALLAVLAIAAAVIALAQHGSWQRSVADQAGFAVGADERVVLPPAAPLPMGQVARLTGAPGVTASTPAIRTQIGLPGGQNGTLLALDARAAAQIVPLRRDLAAAPPASLLSALAPAGPASGVPLPGRPARLSITAVLRGAGHTGPAVLSVQLTDAAGLSYLLPAGSLPANGRAHQLTAVVATRPGVDYPLRLTGYTLAFSMPLRPTIPDVLAISSVRTASTASGPFGPPLADVAGGGLLVSTITAESTAANLAFGPGGITRPPAVISTGYADRFRGGITVTFATGAGNLYGEPGSPLIPASLTVTTQPAVTVLPALATAGFLAATGQHPGATVQVSLNGVTLPVRLAGTIREFPTLTGPGGLVVDQATLQDMLQAAGTLPLPAAEWWLRTSRTAVLPGLPAGTTIVRQASLARALAAQPLSAGPQQAMLGIAAAAVLLAIAGFLVSVVTAGDRARDVALLDALGTPPGQVTGLLCLEQAVAAGLAIAAGLVLGAVLSRLIIPAVSLTAAATHPVPAVLVEIPWRLAVTLAVLIVAVPTAAVAIAATARGSTAARLRAEEDT